MFSNKVEPLKESSLSQDTKTKSKLIISPTQGIESQPVSLSQTSFDMNDMNSRNDNGKYYIYAVS